MTNVSKSYEEVKFLKQKKLGVKNEYDDNNLDFTIDIPNNRYPFSIVWGTLPCLSWLCPLIGHLGITDSKGRVHDFNGPYSIGIDDFMTGAVVKYWQIDPRKLDFTCIRDGEVSSHAEAWDLSLAKGDAQYRKMMHTLCWNNCHSHVRYCFNMMGINDNTIWLFIKFLLHCKYVTCTRAFFTYLPFLIIFGLIFLFSYILPNA